MEERIFVLFVKEDGAKCAIQTLLEKTRLILTNAGSTTTFVLYIMLLDIIKMKTAGDNSVGITGP